MKFILLITACFVISNATNAQTIQTFAGNGTLGFSGEGGPATNAQFNQPTSVVVDRSGNIYFADNSNNVIHKIDTFGTLSRFAGNALRGNSGDGGPATAARLALNYLTGMAVDSIGDVFFSDSIAVRKVDTSGVISTAVGNGTAGYSGDGGMATAAQIYAPIGLAFDKAGNLYIVDNTANVIRKVNSTGIISTIAGSDASGFSGDGGPATDALLGGPQGIAVDDSGNIYLTNTAYLNSYHRLRKINTAGIINTIAGGGSTGSFCDGCAATSLQLFTPFGITADHNGNIYMTDGTSELIHEITPSGLAYHIAGTGVFGYSGDGGPAPAATMNGPAMLCLNTNGDLLFADENNNCLRKITSVTDVTVVEKARPQLSVFPNPHIGNQFSVAASSLINEKGTISISDISGREVFISAISTNTTQNITLPLTDGLYLITVNTPSGRATSLMVCE